jgi:hypothetical protein
MCQLGNFHLIAGCKVKKRQTLIMVTNGTAYNYCNIEAVCNMCLQSQYMGETVIWYGFTSWMLPL